MFLIDVGGRLLSWGGIDFSNSPPGYCTLMPEDQDVSAKRLREGIKELGGKDIDVVIADTEWKLDKFGTVDIAVGCSAIQPVSKGFGARDLYGNPKFGGVDDLSDLVSAAANLLFGQADEAIPIAIVRGLDYERSKVRIRNVVYPASMLGKAVRTLVWESLKFKLLSKLWMLT
ncbi:MAG: coenzyme F420-0:L-glutamate ligase [Candidatus Caldarchaeum sp.]